MEYTIVNGELYHHGIKGQKWGVRRFQNVDGSLTNAGKKRYSSDELRSMAKQVGEYNIGKSMIQRRAALERKKADSKYDRESIKLRAQKDKMSKRDYDKAFDKLGKDLDSSYKISDKKAAESEKKIADSLKKKYGIDVTISAKEIQRNPIRTAIALAGQRKAESLISNDYKIPKNAKIDGPSEYPIPKNAKTDGSSDYQPRRPKNVLY